MSEKERLLALLRDELERWEGLLAGMSEDQLTARGLPAGLSIKDVVGHLQAWQQVSVERLEAALARREPVYAGWPVDDPDAEENLETINAWIHATYRDQLWAQVHGAWRDGYRRFIELSEAMPDDDLLGPGVYPWLSGRPLAAVLEGLYDHHHEEHYGPLSAWLREHGGPATA